jgi:hypothetical protein
MEKSLMEKKSMTIDEIENFLLKNSVMTREDYDNILLRVEEKSMKGRMSWKKNDQN